MKLGPLESTEPKWSNQSRTKQDDEKEQIYGTMELEGTPGHSKPLRGPVTIAQIADDVSQSGWKPTTSSHVYCGSRAS